MDHDYGHDRLAEKEKSSGSAEDNGKLLDRRYGPDTLIKGFHMSHFDVNAILRGMQLTLVGAHRALQNPQMFTNDLYRQVAIAILIGIAIRAIVSIPIFAVKMMLWIMSFLLPMDTVTWDDAVIDGLNFVGEYVLQVPFFLMTLMRHIVPTLDDLFMQSLRWVDTTYVQKHKADPASDQNCLYYSNLAAYSTSHKPQGPKASAGHGLSSFLYRFFRKGFISLAVFGLSYLPVVGQFVLPAASYYTFYAAVGLGPASMIFGVGVFLPRRYLVMFLQTYFSSRNLMRDLLEPYFTRVHFSKSEKKNWFMNRGGVLFGFGLGFYFLVRIPLVGVLMYGIAEASTAYLITKVTDPPPHPSRVGEYAASQQIWDNRHKFLRLRINDLDD